jgi:hypothetical protein
MFVRNKQSSLLDPFISYEKNEGFLNTQSEAYSVANVILEQYFKRHPTTKFNKTPSAKYILL